MLENNKDSSDSSDSSGETEEVLFPYQPFNPASDLEDAEINAIYSDIQDRNQGERLSTRELRLRLILQLSFEWADLAERKNHLDRYLTIDDETKVEGVLEDTDYFVLLLTPDGHVPPFGDTDSMEQVSIRFRKVDIEYEEEYGEEIPNKFEFLRIEHRKPANNGISVDRFVVYEEGIDMWQEDAVGTEGFQKVAEEDEDRILHELSYVIYHFRLAPQRRGSDTSGERVLGFLANGTHDHQALEEFPVDTEEIPHLVSFDGLKGTIDGHLDTIIALHEEADIAKERDLGVIELDNLRIDNDNRVLMFNLVPEERDPNDKSKVEITLQNVITSFDFLENNRIKLDVSSYDAIHVREYDAEGLEVAVYAVSEESVVVSSKASEEKNTDGKYELYSQTIPDEKLRLEIYIRLALRVGGLVPGKFS